ncbi:interleukin-17D isoform X1 [Tachysurus fulvidraco]|uniref:interleukin-17D isoform X1 n=1 Tax=Tachysurus fulvidraco TaxID=1234273 RepID=UPI001FEF640E|nr:interleukin-17D isoform X1 [Tachysurus fulvidraco]
MPGAEVVALLVVVVSCAARGGKGNRRLCADLPEEILEQRFGRLSVGVLSAFHHTLQLTTEPQNLSCPSSGLMQSFKRSGMPVNLLSLSPWAYRLRHEPSRYPRYIPEAYCLCKGCLTGPSGEESEDYRSVPVFVPTAVLRRSGSCVGGRRSYTESYESIAVGCTCVPALRAHKSAHRNNQSTRTVMQKSNTRRKAGGDGGKKKLPERT